jgi:hypothetical protein
MPQTYTYFAATPTPRRVPEPFLRAEIATYPLASETSFQEGLLKLDPQVTKNSKTGNLWRACEHEFAPYTGWSLDRLVAARDRGWFGSKSRLQPIPMHKYLRALARDHLVPRAGVTEIEESTTLTTLDAADHYRWLTLTLPEDLLLVGLGVHPAPVRVDLDPPLLVRRLLDLGVAEIHQHVGASMDFPLLWASALAAIATPAVEEDALTSPGAPLSDGKDLVRWLLAAAVARCTLAEYLIRGDHREDHNFHTFVQEAFLTPTHGAWTPRRREMLAAVLQALDTADAKRLPAFEPLRDLYADIHPTALILDDHPLESATDAFRRCDPIAVRLDLHGTNAGERWLLRKALAYLDSKCRAPDGTRTALEDPHDEYFARIFWQTVRLRCQYYRTVVERPFTGGLQWFIRFYSRLGRLRDPLTPIQPEISFRVAGKGHRIRALEMRTSVADTAITIGEGVLGFLRSWQRVLQDTSQAMFEPEMGVIFHFIKDRDPAQAWSQGTPPAFWSDTFAEPGRERGKDVAHGRYVAYYADQCRKACALAELITAVPSSLWVIRGLDVATDELGIPTWVLVPLFRHVLDASARVSILEEGLAPLKVTAHVGEDFRHLLEGMRRIYEQVHYILGGATGRLGHAIALGVDPQAWAESVGSVLTSAEERLWDLVCEWRLYTKYRIRPEYAAEAPPGRAEMLLNQVHDLAGHIFKRVYRIEALAEAHHVLHRFLVPPLTQSPAVEGGYDTFVRAARSIKENSDPERVHDPRLISEMLEVYLEDESAFRRGQTLIDVPLRADEVEALNAVQHALRRGIAQRGIVIEVNPSSNLLIGDLLDLRNHPILRLNPPVPDQHGPPPVAIALGSDDPLTFSTELLREYTLLYQAACAAGYPERVVHEWLESIRRTGMDARFTRGWRPSAAEKTAELISAMCTYLHEPYGCSAGCRSYCIVGSSVNGR